MAATTYVANITPITAETMQALNDFLYTLMQVSDGVALTEAKARAALKTGALLTTVVGTNTITATSSPAPTAYASGDLYILIPANNNTGATTLNISGLGAKNILVNAAACAGGELVVNVPYLLEYDGTQFQVVGWTQPSITNTLAADVDLNNTATYFTGPTCAQGTVGKWFASGSVTLTDTTVATSAQFLVKLWDGTTVIASGIGRITNSNYEVTIHLSGPITTPAGNIRMSVKDVSGTTGKILFNTSGNSKDSTLTVTRVG